MKKMAIKGLVALAAVVALCMFFSGTIKTISTAKVRLVTAKQGKLEEEIKLSGNLTFTQTEEVKLALASDQSVTIKRVRVAKGRRSPRATCSLKRRSPAMTRRWKACAATTKPRRKS